MVGEPLEDKQKDYLVIFGVDRLFCNFNRTTGPFEAIAVDFDSGNEFNFIRVVGVEVFEFVFELVDIEIDEEEVVGLVHLFGEVGLAVLLTVIFWGKEIHIFY